MQEENLEVILCPAGLSKNGDMSIAMMCSRKDQKGEDTSQNPPGKHSLEKKKYQLIAGKELLQNVVSLDLGIRRKKLNQLGTPKTAGQNVFYIRLY